MRLANSGEHAWPITFVITSCARFDLLELTLASFLAHNAAPISRYVLVEDSGDARVREVVAKLGVPFEIIINDPPLGQMAAIDRVYQGITTPYIFHCEDDWRFFRSGFVEESMAVLAHDQSITAVLSRRPGENASNDLMFACPVQLAGGVRYHKATPWLDPFWLGYSFNPGLRRLSDYRALGSFTRWGHERDASLFFKLRGRTLAILAEPACETTGLERGLPQQAVARSRHSRWQMKRASWRYKLAQLINRSRGRICGRQKP